MTNRELSYIVKDQKPLVLEENESVGYACRAMRSRGVGSVLVVDAKKNLKGIFTGRDAVRLVAKDDNAADVPLGKAMTRAPVVVKPTSRAIDALRAMADAECRHLPVVHEGTIYGVLSRRDFKGMELETFVRQQSGTPTDRALDRNVSDAMEPTTPLILPSSKTIREACRSMRRRKCGCALVVDAQGHLVGIFTGRDAVRAIAEGKKSGSTKLSNAMTKPPLTISPERHAVEALRIMSDGGFRHLPVVEDNKIRGVVTRNSFTAVELDRLDEEEHLKECIW
jgi:CBS domain-containing protein